MRDDGEIWRVYTPQWVIACAPQPSQGEAVVLTTERYGDKVKPGEIGAEVVPWGGWHGTIRVPVMVAETTDRARADEIASGYDTSWVVAKTTRDDHDLRAYGTRPL